MILNMFMNENLADVIFEVEDGDVSPTLHATFHGHRFILEQCAPDLVALCGSGIGLTSVPITGVKPEIFRHLLYYVYGGKWPRKIFPGISLILQIDLES